MTAATRLRRFGSAALLVAALALLAAAPAGANGAAAGAAAALRDRVRASRAAHEKREGGRAVTVLGVTGSLFFAGARTLADALPTPRGATPWWCCACGGAPRWGATLVDVLDDYADDLAGVGGRLYLSGVHADVAAQLRRSGKLDRSVSLVPASTVFGASTERALVDASAWLKEGAASGGD